MAETVAVGVGFSVVGTIGSAGSVEGWGDAATNQMDATNAPPTATTATTNVQRTIATHGQTVEAGARDIEMAPLRWTRPGGDGRERWQQTVRPRSILHRRATRCDEKKASRAA